MVTVSFVPDVSQCTAAARVFPELARWRWTRFAEGTAVVLVAAALVRLVGPGPWLVGSLAGAAVLVWSLLTVFGPWYAPRRLRRTFWIDELVTCRITDSTLVWWSQPGVREVPWHAVEAVGTRDGVLALRTGRPYQLIWLPLALVTPDQVAEIVRRAASMGADTRAVDLAGARLASLPEPAGVGARADGADAPADRWFDSVGGPAEPAGRATRFERPALDEPGRPIEITARVGRRQAVALFRSGRMTDRSPVVGLLAGGVAAAVLVLLPAAMALLPEGALLGFGVGEAAVAVASGVGIVVGVLRALARRVAAGRYLMELGDEPGVWQADPEGLTMVTRAGRQFAPWSDVVDGRLEEGLLVLRCYGRRRQIGVPIDGCPVSDVDRLLCWLGTAGVWILAV